MEDCREISWFVNLMDILDDTDVYVDGAHVSTKGNEIIANHICRFIEDMID